MLMEVFAPVEMLSRVINGSVFLSGINLSLTGELGAVAEI